MSRLPLPRRALAFPSMTLPILALALSPAALHARPQFGPADVVAVDSASDATDARGDLLSLSLRSIDGTWTIRVGMTGAPGTQVGLDSPAFLRVRLVDRGGATYSGVARARLEKDALGLPREDARYLDWSATEAAGVALTAARESGRELSLVVDSIINGQVVDTIQASWPSKSPSVYVANCAFVQHGNQGLAYTDAFFGSSSDPAGTGFDEALEVHEGTGVPGNFHVSGTLITAAEWDRNQGNPADFNGWLRAGVQSGWAAMVSSAYAQHIMPFATQEMNDWAVNTQAQLVATTYGYTPHTAWIPERTWLDPSRYPNNGVVDWPGDNFLPHGIWAVILDDDVHLSGWDNHQIHTITNGLRIIPRDRNFTGNIVGGNGQAALDILTGLANSGVGDYRIAVYAEDWEAAGEIGFWRDTTPNAKETYDWIVGKVATEAWINAWRIDDAVQNPNFNGSTISQISTGTYVEIGGSDGYGGGNNGWYTDWAGYVPYVTGGDGSGACGGSGNCRNYGAMWNASVSKLLTVPDNNLSQAGWYVLMTNLHETAWHDGMGAPISGWQHKYSAHTKNALVYAEAARWAAGLYAEPIGAYQSDLDEDGYDEVVLYNERLFAYFEATGGRAVNVFAKDGSGEFSAVGVDNAYWYGTDADFNDGNHVGAFSDVGPDHQHENYTWNLDTTTAPVVQITFHHASGLEKTISLESNAPYLRAVYRTHGGTQWVQSGMSPGLVDLIWNADMDRVWATDQSYMGRRNPNTGATVAFVLGQGGASHQKEISATLMKGDEIFGTDTFEFYLFAGSTPAPVGGEIPELRNLATALVDQWGPRADVATYFPGTDRLRIEFDQPVSVASVDPTAITVATDGSGTGGVALDPATTVVETGSSAILTFQLTSADALAIEALGPSLFVLLTSDVGIDDNAVPAIASTLMIGVGEATAVTIDGRLEDSEWRGPCELAWIDPVADSAWTASNEIDGAYARWDANYLYLAVDGTVTGNSWILYLDVDPDGAGGQTDLTAIDTWERGATFTAPGFAPDFEYGCYQHQGPYDSDGFFRLDSATTTTDLSSSIVSAFDSQHLWGVDSGSELAIPWEVLYNLAPGLVPPGAELAFAVSLTWDPEPDGELGGDVLPGGSAASLPVITQNVRFVVDGDGDGLPDPVDSVGPQLTNAEVMAPVASPKLATNLQVLVSFDEPVEQSSAVSLTNYSVYETGNPSQTLAVRGAQLYADSTQVLLTIEEPGVSSTYTLSVANAIDTSCAANRVTLQSVQIALDRVTDVPAIADVRAATLRANVPNPFNPSTRVRFALPSGGAQRVDIEIFDLRGRRVRRLVVGESLPDGEHFRIWNGVDDRGRPVASGDYVVRLVADGVTRTQKLSLAK